MAETGALSQAGGRSLSLRERLERRWGALKLERASWDTHVRDVFDQTRPRRTRFTQTQTNKGDRRNYQIINNTGVIASRVLTSGMVNGMSSPAQQWFKYEPQDLELREYGPVKKWLDELQRLVRRIFEASNVYETLPVIYEELGLAATGAAVIEDDFQDVIRLQPFTWGEYCLAIDGRRVVDTLYRDLRMTTLQVIERFGLDNVSQTVRAAYDQSNYDGWVDVMHAIEPNNDRDASKADARNMAWRSIYWEQGAQTEPNKFLRVSGYAQNPIIAPRWDVVGNDVYGSSCPGMEALGDMRQVQIQEKDKGTAIQLMNKPPTQGPPSLSDRFVGKLPGNHTVTPSGAAGGGVTPIYQINQNIETLNKDIENTEARINKAFYVDYILSISQMEGVQPRNQWEISERKGEGLLVLGPVVQRLQNELHSPLHERTLNRIYEVCVPLWKQGLPAMIAPPPPELQGMPIRIVYSGPLAKIQEAAGAAGIERLLSVVTANPITAQLFPDMIDKIDGAHIIEELGNMYGAPAKVVRSDEDAAALAQQRQQQQQAAQLAAMAKPAADAASAAKSLSEAHVGGGKGALEAMLDQARQAQAQGQDPTQSAPAQTQ